jgi:hypothetical protein
VRGAAGNHDAPTRRYLDLSVVDAEGQHALSHIPGFIVTVMTVQGSDGAGRVGTTARIGHLRKNQVTACGGDGAP